MNLEEKLHMIGIDHTRAGIEIREQFAMTGNLGTVREDQIRKSVFRGDRIIHL